jgi:subtilase family serine protease
MNRKLGLVAVVVAIVGLAVTSKGVSSIWAAEKAPRTRVLITRPIDERHLIRLAGNTRREANSDTDRGRVRDDFPMEHMLLLLKRPPQLEQEFEQYIDSLTDKSSPNFHRWLMPDEQGQKYGLAQEDIDIVTGWLQSHGFTVGYVYPNRRVIDFSGTAGEIREAFHTEIHHLDVRGEHHFANMSDPQIPEALAPVVLGVVSMHDFKPHPYLKPRTQYRVTSGSNTYNLVVPADVQTIYNLAPIYRQGIYGQGQTIVVVEDAMPWSTDPTTYQTTFGLNVYGGSWTNTHPNAGNNCTAPASPNPDEGEANIDVDVAMAVAPGATVQVASCNDGTPVSTFGGLLALENLVSTGTPPAVISMSYGECEAGSTQAGNAAFYSAFQSAAAAGVSVFVSSGDELSTSCSNGYNYGYFGIGVTGWGSTPYNVSVGGTDFEDTYNAKEAGIPVSTYWNSNNSTIDGNAKSYIPEIPWNDSCASWLISNYNGISNTYGTSGFCNSTTGEADYLTISGGSGGPSGCANGASTNGYVRTGCAGYTKPSWQAGIFGNPADGVRDLPDVSLFASNGAWGHYYVICWSDTTNYPPATYGTAPCTNPPNPEASSPTWSGFGGTSFSAPMMAAVQALVNQKWNMRAGNPDPIYYQIAKAEFGSSGNSACFSINQPPRRGLASSCVFYDITQGDINANCLQNGTSRPCYIPSGTNGVLSTEPVSAVSVISGGSGYTTAPTCSLGAPATSEAYLSPAGGTIYAGGTQAGSCTATINAGSLAETGTVTIGSVTPSVNVTTGWAGATLTVGSTTYTFVTGTPTAVNQVELYTAGTASTNRTNTARNLEAVINANALQCASTGCVHSGQAANSSVTATEATNTVTVTARTSGVAGDFVLAANNNLSSDIIPTVTTNGAGPGYVSSIAFTASGAGYAGGSGCTLSGGGGSGATCAAEVNITAAPTAYAPAFYATPGWDFATGIGTVNVYNLVFNTAW